MWQSWQPQKSPALQSHRPSRLRETLCPHPALPTAGQGLGNVLQQPLPDTRAGLGWGSGGANPTGQGHSPTCPTHLPRAVWQLSVRRARSDSTGGARPARAARSNQCHCRDTCQILLPGWLPLLPVSVWKSQAVTSISPQESRSPRQNQDLQDSRRESGGAFPMKAHTVGCWFSQPRCVTHSRLQARNNSVCHSTHLCLTRLHPQLKR